MPVLSAYKEWVKQHPSLVAYFESGLSTLSYLLPDRFQSTEYFYESLNAFIGLASIWHTSILKEDDPLVQQPSSALWLAALQQIETLVEIRAMHLERLGKMSRYGPLAVLELLKAALRLHILNTLPGRLLVNDALQDDISQQDVHEKAADKRVKDLLRALERFALKSNGVACSSTSATACHHDSSLSSPKPAPAPPTASPSQVPTYISASASDASLPEATNPSGQSCPGCAPKASTQAPLSPPSSSAPEPQQQHWWQLPPLPPQQSISPPTPAPPPPSAAERHKALLLIHIAELLHIYRPVIYVLLLHKCQRKSWTPWLASLATDMASSYLQSNASALLRDFDHMVNPKPSSLYSLSMLRAFTSFHWSSAEQRELARRKMQLAMYLLRSPCFEAVTARALHGIQRRLQNVPLIGVLGEKLVEIVEGLQQYYTYTSAS